jgi:hypothetical protein
MADKINLVVEQGADFRRVLEVRDESGTLLDLTGYVFRGQAKTDYSSSKSSFDINFTIRDQVASLGMVDLHISADSTSALNLAKASDYIYDIEMVDGASEVRRIMEGKIKVYPEVTK